MQMVLAAAGFTHDEHARTRPPLLSTVSMCFQSSAGNGVYVIPTRPLPTPSFAHSIFCSLHLPHSIFCSLRTAPLRTAPRTASQVHRHPGDLPPAAGGEHHSPGGGRHHLPDAPAALPQADHGDAGARGGAARVRGLVRGVRRRRGDQVEEI